MSNSEQSVSRFVSLHGFVASIEYPHLLSSMADIVFSAYPAVVDSPTVDLQITIAQDADDEKIWLVSYDDRDQKELSTDRAVSRAEWLVVTYALLKWKKFIHVHAGLVGNHSTSALLIGDSGRGKSTTSVALASMGWRLYSDDVALLDRTTFAACVCPRPIKLDEHARKLLEPAGLTVSASHTVGESVGRSFLPGLPDVDQVGPPVSSAYFIARDRASSPRITRIPKSESALYLMKQSSSDFDAAEGLTPEAFSLIEQIDCYELVAAELFETARLLSETIESYGR